jgi:hypothetical protein
MSVFRRDNTRASENLSTAALALELLRTARAFLKSETAAQVVAILSDANQARATAVPVVVESQPTTAGKHVFRALRTTAYLAVAFAVGAVASRNATVQQLAGEQYDRVRDAAPEALSHRLPERHAETVGAPA